MKTRSLAVWDTLRSSFWFLPAVLAVASVGLAFAMLALDRQFPVAPDGAFGLLSAEVSSVRALFSTIAGSLITVLGVVFSTTIVTLSLAAQQLGPRILRTFMRDRGNQLTMGILIATFLYSLLVLRTLSPPRVPYISSVTAIVLTLASTGFLIYFIHNLARSIQAPNVIATVSRELHGTIERFTQASKNSTERPSSPPGLGGNAGEDKRIVRVTAEGYLQEVNIEVLMHLAVENDLLIAAAYRPGDFLIRGNKLADVFPGSRTSDKLARRIARSFYTGTYPTDTQDVEFGVHELVEIALRALSPSLNDPFTAMECIDRIAAALAHLAGTDLPAQCRSDETGRTRLILPVPAFSQIAGSAFDPVREVARSHTAVHLRLLERIGSIEEHLRTGEQRQILVRQLDLIYRGAMRSVEERHDRERISAAYEEARKAFGSREPAP